SSSPKPAPPAHRAVVMRQVTPTTTLAIDPRRPRKRIPDLPLAGGAILAHQGRGFLRGRDATDRGAKASARPAAGHGGLPRRPAMADPLGRRAVSGPPRWAAFACQFMPDTWPKKRMQVAL